MPEDALKRSQAEPPLKEKLKAEIRKLKPNAPCSTAPPKAEL
jgi:hypothetical protein